MKKLIKTVGINEQRGEALREKAVELMLKSKTPVKESEIVHYMIDNLLDYIDIDQHGIYFVEDEEKESQKSETVKQKIRRGRQK